MIHENGYDKGYEDAIDRLYEIKKKTETGSFDNPFSTVQQGLDAINDSVKWTWMDGNKGDTTIHFSISDTTWFPKYLRLKIVGTGKSEIHAYLNVSDSTWVHHIIELK